MTYKALVWSFLRSPSPFLFSNACLLIATDLCVLWASRWAFVPKWFHLFQVGALKWREKSLRTELCTLLMPHLNMCIILRSLSGSICPEYIGYLTARACMCVPGREKTHWSVARFAYLKWCFCCIQIYQHLFVHAGTVSVFQGSFVPRHARLHQSSELQGSKKEKQEEKLQMHQLCRRMEELERIRRFLPGERGGNEKRAASEEPRGHCCVIKD